jgi:excisionase family DNA binding protein
VTSYGDMSAAGLRVLDLLTVSEVAVRLGCSAKRVTSLAAAGELTRVDMGVLARITPESVTAYEQRQAAGAEVP